jgi:uncharacterized membrane protein YhaH (DUF805 family)
MNFDFNRLYLTAEGRIGRQEFWIGVIGLVVIGIVLGLLIWAIAGMESFAARLLTFIAQVVLAYPGYCLMAKRFQDRDRAGSLAAIVVSISVLIGLVGLLGLTGTATDPNWLGALLGLVNLAIFIWIVIDLGILRGTVGDNQYGPDPVAET